MSLTDVVAKFAEASCVDRVQSLVELLRACSPFEVRFAGILVEELGACSFADLQPRESQANDPGHLLTISQENGPIPSAHMLFEYVPLLSRFNFQASTIMTDIMMVCDYLFE